MSAIETLAKAELPAQRSALSTGLWKVEAAVAHRRLRRIGSELPRRLNLGCGTVFADGWTNADFATIRWAALRRTRWPDWNMDATRSWMCPDDYFEAIHCEHLLEHFPYRVSLEVLRECWRTLRPHGVLRVVLPDLNKFIGYYRGEAHDAAFERFGVGPVALSKLTQCDGHLSVWDGSIVCAVLDEMGFADVSEVGPAITRQAIPPIDSPDRFWESLYVEAVKPGVTPSRPPT